MVDIKKFSQLPSHQELLDQAIEVLKDDERILSLYLSGHSQSDEYSDIDLTLICKGEDKEALVKDIKKLAEEVGKIKVEAWAGVPDTYVVFYEPEHIKIDYMIRSFPAERRADKAHIDIIFDKTGDLEKLKHESAKMDWKLDKEYLKGRVQHFYVGLSYTVAKIGRGELWDGKDCVDFYLKYLTHFEDLLSERKSEGYRRLEQKLTEEQLESLEKCIAREISRKELLRAMDAVMNYFDKFLKEKLIEQEVFPSVYAEKMTEYYKQKRNEIGALFI